MTHTPTPWVARDEYIYSQDRIEIGTTTTSGFYHGTDDANAAHIVKCVNLHDDLVEALKECAAAFNLHAEQYPHMVKGYTLDAFNAAYETLKKAGAL